MVIRAGNTVVNVCCVDSRLLLFAVIPTFLGIAPWHHTFWHRFIYGLDSQLLFRIAS